MERDQDERVNTGKNGRWSEEGKRVISNVRFSDNFQVTMPRCGKPI